MELFSKLKLNQNIPPLENQKGSFVVDDMHVLDFGTLVGANGICLRVGNMCASWIHQRLGLTGSIRISVGPWNTMQDIEKFVSVVKGIVK